MESIVTEGSWACNPLIGKLRDSGDKLRARGVKMQKRAQGTITFYNVQGATYVMRCWNDGQNVLRLFEREWIGII